MTNDNTSSTDPVKQVNNRDYQGRFPPGVSGNPNGRPLKGHSITDTIRRMMDSRPEIKDALATKALEMALGGDLPALRVIWTYLEGVPGFRREEDVVTQGEYSDLTDEQLDELIKSKLIQVGIGMARSEPNFVTVAPDQHLPDLTLTN